MAAVPVFILSPGRSYSTVVSAMLGRHGQVYAFPELSLFARETMAEFLSARGVATFDAGLVRAVCDLLLTSYSADDIARARRWIYEQRSRSTHAVFELLAARTNAAVVVEKTPLYTAMNEHLERLERLFNGKAHFLHLTRHPIAFGRSLVETYRDFARVVGDEIARTIARHPESLFFGLLSEDGDYVPDGVWYTRNRRIAAFLDTVDPVRVRRWRGEDVVNCTADAARDIAQWLHLPLEEEDLAAMREPEKWCHAAPDLAHGDRHFRQRPQLRAIALTERLTDQPAWPTRCIELPAKVRELGEFLGYD